MAMYEESGTTPTDFGLGIPQERQELPRGTVLGRYVIIEPIGSGGMGSIYRAYDPELNRGVALKILSVKLVDEQAASRAKTRLIREAQALAQLSHPNVVAVHDVGSFQDDVFIAMELIEGKTLKQWLEEEPKPVKEILPVMTAAGRGLQAAHQAGLVHRDFKPGNVIVGDDGRVRVLDFGLARAVEQDQEDQVAMTADEVETQLNQEPSHDSEDASDSANLGELTPSSTPNLLLSPLTQVGGVLGTPLYMAPEQHLGQNTDARTDQFAFCVVLYEALYGARPFAAKTIKQLKNNVIQNRLKPPAKDTDIPKWIWQIVDKGLKTKPEDRYPGMAALLADLEKDPDESRRQRQLRHRRNFVIISLVLLIIVVPMGLWVGLKYRTVQLCKEEAGAFAGVWDEKTQSSIRQSFLATNKPYALGTWNRVERKFDTYRAEWNQMRSELCEARLVRATQSEELFDLRMRCLQKRVRELGALAEVFARADAGVLEKAVQASSSLTGMSICADEEALRAPYPPPKTAQAKMTVRLVRRRLAQVQAYYRTGKYPEGLQLAQTAQDEAKTLDYRPVQAQVWYWLGVLLNKTGDNKQAQNILYRASEAAGESKDTLLAAKAMTELVWVIGRDQARYKAGLLIARDAKVMLNVAGKNNRVRARLLKNWASMYNGLGQYDQALTYLRQAQASIEKEQGSNHLDLSRILNNMGVAYNHLGDYPQALAYYQKTLAIQEKSLGAQHPIVAMSLNNIASVFLLQHQYDKALEYYRKSLAIRKQVLGEEHSDVAMTLCNMGMVYYEQENYAKAMEFNRHALGIWERVLGPEHPMLAYPLLVLGNIRARKAEITQALAHYRRALAIREKVLGPEHPFLAEPLRRLGGVLIGSNRPLQALSPLQRLVTLCEKKTCHTGAHASGLFELARAMLVTGKNKTRAIQLAKQARLLFSKNPQASQNDIKMIDLWLQKRKKK